MVQTKVREILHNIVSLKYRPYVFPPVILDELDCANETEQVNGEKKALQNCTTKMLQDMSPDLNNCALLLKNLMFECFTYYMVTLK